MAWRRDDEIFENNETGIEQQQQKNSLIKDPENGRYSHIGKFISNYDMHDVRNIEKK